MAENGYEVKMEMAWHDVDVDSPKDNVPCLLIVKQVVSEEADERDAIGYRTGHIFLTGDHDEFGWFIYGQAEDGEDLGGGMLQESPANVQYCKQRVLYWAYLPSEKNFSGLNDLDFSWGSEESIKNQVQ